MKTFIFILFLFLASLTISAARPPKNVQTIQYSQSARAAQMILPAYFLGMPLFIIIALILVAYRNEK